MVTSVTLTTAPTAEPITLSELKSWARVVHCLEDTMLQNILTGARQEAEKYLNRSLMPQVWKLSLDLPPSGLDNALGDGVYDTAISELYACAPRTVLLPYAPVSSITSVTTYGFDNVGTVYSASNYTLNAASNRLVLNETAYWPDSLRPVAAIEVLYATGYTDAATIPQAIKIAILTYAAALYENRGVCDADKADPIIAMQNSLHAYRNYIYD